MEATEEVHQRGEMVEMQSADKRSDLEPEDGIASTEQLLGLRTKPLLDPVILPDRGEGGPVELGPLVDAASRRHRNRSAVVIAKAETQEQRHERARGKVPRQRRAS